jgi:hypothetical protein
MAIASGSAGSCTSPKTLAAFTEMASSHQVHMTAISVPALKGPCVGGVVGVVVGRVVGTVVGSVVGTVVGSVVGIVVVVVVVVGVVVVVVVDDDDVVVVGMVVGVVVGGGGVTQLFSPTTATLASTLSATGPALPDWPGGVARLAAPDSRSPRAATAAPCAEVTNTDGLAPAGPLESDPPPEPSGLRREANAPSTATAAPASTCSFTT